ncbi:hypothetical protein STRTUCAR8_04170 [Streptomyces turgidiscabies Car8]|uniref:Uncharacterized protein n=1 Tax=Streptomyces turgidiscabies (strain Car8) TaxID=698760 RepID=L7FC26_STRT8|nr:hypothetical protein STRTUCAR8_04170 [Streptomyces turgidiscabies Car8]
MGVWVGGRGHRRIVRTRGGCALWRGWGPAVNQGNSALRAVRAFPRRSPQEKPPSAAPSSPERSLPEKSPRKVRKKSPKNSAT